MIDDMLLVLNFYGLMYLSDIFIFVSMYVSIYICVSLSLSPSVSLSLCLPLPLSLSLSLPPSLSLSGNGRRESFVIHLFIFCSHHSTDDTDSEGDTTKGDHSVVPKPDPETLSQKLKNTNASSLQTSEEIYEYSTKVRWQMSSAITTQHLLSVISVANTLMSMSRASFLMMHQPIKK